MGKSGLWYVLTVAHRSTEDHYPLQLGARGRIVLPAPVRRRLDLHPGDRLILTLKGPGEVLLTRAEEAARSGRGLLKAAAGNRSLVDELIAERRGDAEGE